MLNEYCLNVLKAELSKPDYDGKDAAAAWSWLMDTTVSERDEPTNLLLTPSVAASILGPTKANAIAVAVKRALPGIADDLLRNGVNVSNPETGKFLGSLTAAGIPAEDIAAINALGTKKVTTITPRRFDSRFYPALWPHVGEDGTPNADGPAISGFPNTIERADFDKAWELAGRNG